jgi:hypothetical protein
MTSDTLWAGLRVNGPACPESSLRESRHADWSSLAVMEGLLEPSRRHVAERFEQRLRLYHGTRSSVANSTCSSLYHGTRRWLSEVEDMVPRPSTGRTAARGCSSSRWAIAVRASAC